MGRYKKETLCESVRISVQPVLQYDPERLIGPDRFQLQNFLLRQYNFPAELLRGDHFQEVWSDQTERATWLAAMDLLEIGNRLGGFVLDDSTDVSFLAMCQRLIGKTFTATGGMAVLFRDGDRIRIRLSIVRTGPDRALYDDNNGPHVRTECPGCIHWPGSDNTLPSWSSIARALHPPVRQPEPSRLDKLIAAIPIAELV